MGPTQSGEGIGPIDLRADGGIGDTIMATHEDPYIRMDGISTFKIAVKRLSESTVYACAAAGIAASPEADLGLFDGNGRPTPHLARLMRNMAAVEIGPLGAGPGLVDAAVARAAEMVAARRPPAPGAPPAGRLDEARRPEPRP